jgi:hypothetical protein
MLGEAREIYWTYAYEWNGYWFDSNVGFFEMLWQPQNYFLEVNRKPFRTIKHKLISIFSSIFRIMIL